MSKAMRLNLVAMLLCLLTSGVPALAAGKISVVATTPDLASLAREVGGDLIEAVALAQSSNDPEAFQPRPADVIKLKSAQLVVRVGADFDLWLDRLLFQAGNVKLMKGAAGYVDASAGIALIEVSAASLGTSGHAHGAGNPHYWLDPHNAEAITGSILEGLVRIDSSHAARYEAQRNAFLSKLAAKLKTWEARLAPLRGMPVIAYHNAWPYFARRFRLNVVDYIEPKPGIPPSPAHLARLLGRMKDEHIRIVLKDPFESSRIPDMLASRAAGAVVVLAPTVGAVPQAADYLSLFDFNVNAIARAWAARS